MYCSSKETLMKFKIQYYYAYHYKKKNDMLSHKLIKLKHWTDKIVD